MRKTLAAIGALSVLCAVDVSDAWANGTLPVIIHTCESYKIASPSIQGRPADSFGTYVIVDSNNNVIATADNVEVATTNQKHCLGVVDIEADQAVLDGLLNDELFITVRTCTTSVSGPQPSSCTFGEETLVLTESEAIDTVLGDVVNGISVVTDALAAALAQEILDRQTGDGALQTSLNQEVAARQAADAALQSLINGNAAAIGNNAAAITLNSSAIGANASGVNANAAGISTNAAGITTNASGIATNANGVATNANGVATNANGVATNANGIAVNSGDIATNASGIATNASGVSTNASGIATNASGISTNASGISTNASGISTNANGIATNASGISTNASGIATNASGISTNASGIATNASGISTNAAGIATNASGISTNASGIASNGGAINTLNGSVGTIQSDVAALQLNKQNRVVGLCPPGSSIRVIDANGGVTCELDNDANTIYTAGNGLTLSGTSFAINPAVTQARVIGTCPIGSSIRAINVGGGVVCEADTVGADNLGNHAASTTLDMNGNNINEVNRLHLVTTTNRITRSNNGQFGSATSFDPNTLKSNGLLIEHGETESAGIYMDGDTMVMWSPGDNDVLRVYDEDSFSAGPIFSVQGNRTVRGEHRELVSEAVTGFDDDGSQDCPANRVARGFDADDFTGFIDRIRLNCAYVR